MKQHTQFATIKALLASIQADLQSGQYQKALALLDSLDSDQLPPQFRAESEYYKGLAWMLSGQHEPAQAALQQATRMQPDNPVYRCNLGELYRRCGQYEQAIEQLEQALTLRPDYAIARYNLACAHLNHEQPRAALPLLRKLIKESNPPSADYFSHLADAYRQLGRAKTALGLYQKALEIQPDHVHTLSNMGPLLLDMGHTDEALSTCRKALDIAPDNGLAHINLGRCLVELEQYDEAMNCFADAYELIPDNELLLTSMGEVWLKVNDWSQAEYWFTQALEHHPDSLNAQCGLADTYREAGLVEQALERLDTLVERHPEHARPLYSRAQAWEEYGDMDACIADYRKILQHHPKTAFYHAALAHALEVRGDLAEAQAEYEKALSKNPNHVGALSGMASLLKAKLPSAYVQRMEQLLEHQELRDQAKSRLHSGLAYYYDGKQQYRTAGHHVEQANRLFWQAKQRLGWEYDPDKHSAWIDQLMALFNADYLQQIRQNPQGLDIETPVFIVGMPRSGTTLTEQILASHPQVLGVGEQPYVHQSFSALPQWATLNAPSEVIIPQLTAEAIQRIGQWHLEQLHKWQEKSGRNDVRYIVDKMPDNYALLGWILTLFPKARIIYARRDLRDVAVSCWMTQFSKLRWAFNQEHLARKIVDHARIMAHWRQLMPIYFPNQWLEIRYEDLVQDPQTHARRLIEFLNLEWSDNCLRHHEQKNQVRTASIIQVRQPIYTHAVARWKRYAHELGDLFEYLDKAGI